MNRSLLLFVLCTDGGLSASDFGFDSIERL